MLLVPGGNRRMLEKAPGLDADVVILDLEDTVPVTDRSKAEARDAVVAALADGVWACRERAVRINGPHTDWFEADLEAVLGAGITTIVLPHTYGVEDVLQVETALAAQRPGAEIDLVLSVETPGLLLDLEEVGRRARCVRGLAVAPNDYCLETGSSALLTALVAGRPGVVVDEQISWLRLKVIAVAKARGWSAFDAVMVADPRDPEALRSALERSRGLGFDGTAVMHPSHVGLVNEVFSPTNTEIDWAKAVAARYEGLTGGGDQSDGVPVLRQHYEVACRTLALADAIGTAA